MKSTAYTLAAILLLVGSIGAVEWWNGHEYIEGKLVPTDGVGTAAILFFALSGIFAFIGWCASKAEAEQAENARRRRNQEDY